MYMYDKSSLESQIAVREVEGLSPRPANTQDLTMTEENVLLYLWTDISKNWLLDIQVFSDMVWKASLLYLQCYCTWLAGDI